MKNKRRVRRRKKNSMRPINFILLIGLLCAILAGLLEKLNTPAPQPEPVTVDPVYLNTYTDDAYYEENGRMYYEDANYESLVGIDVSYAQKEIDWSLVQNAGLDFAIIRAGYRGYTTGELHEDAWFRVNMQGAKEAGLIRGIYWFSQSTSVEEAQEEARFVLNLIKEEQINGPIAYDMEIAHEEGRINAMTRQEKTDVAKAFCAVIKKAGYEPMVYGSASWLKNDIYMEQLQDEVPFWVASYRSEHPNFKYRYEIWQYSCTGSIDGIVGDVDLNVWIKPR